MAKMPASCHCTAPQHPRGNHAAKNSKPSPVPPAASAPFTARMAAVPMTATDIAEWNTFFTAQAAAAAALTGLVFVALSINLRQILADPALPGRAGEALLLLVQPVIVALAALIPRQPAHALGGELLASAFRREV